MKTNINKSLYHWVKYENLRQQFCLRTVKFDKKDV